MELSLSKYLHILEVNMNDKILLYDGFNRMIYGGNAVALKRTDWSDVEFDPRQYCVLSSQILPSLDDPIMSHTITINIMKKDR